MTDLNIFCAFPFTKVKVLDNGDMVMCCHQVTKAFGNLFEKSFDEMWFGEIAEEIRDAVLRNELHPICSRRGVCPYAYSELDVKNVKLESKFPSFLEFDLPNTHCNIGGESPRPETACIMCPRSAKNFVPHQDQMLELADRLKFLMPHLRNLLVSGLSEPFWKGKIFDLLDA